MFAATMAKIAEFLQIKMTIYGATFSFWDLMLWALIASVVCAFIREMLF